MEVFLTVVAVILTLRNFEMQLQKSFN